MHFSIPIHGTNPALLGVLFVNQCESLMSLQYLEVCHSDVKVAGLFFCL